MAGPAQILFRGTLRTLLHLGCNRAYIAGMDRSATFQINPRIGFLTDPSAQALCAVFENAGHRALFVGGCVRNAVMGVPISDIDVATDATPKQTLSLCTAAGFRCIPTGIEHGTVTVLIDGNAFLVMLMSMSHVAATPKRVM